MSEDEPCPFCGKARYLGQQFNDDPEAPLAVISCALCITNMRETSVEEVTEQWNSRPIEDALALRLTAVEKVVEAARTLKIKAPDMYARYFAGPLAAYDAEVKRGNA